MEKVSDTFDGHQYRDGNGLIYLEEKKTILTEECKLGKV